MKTFFQWWDDLPWQQKRIYPKDTFKKVPDTFRKPLFDYLSLHWSDFKTQSEYEAKCVEYQDSFIKAGVMDTYFNIVGDSSFGHHPLEGYNGNSYDVNEFETNHGWDNSPIVEDLGLPSVEEGRQHWGDRYLVVKDPRTGETRHGPAKFRTRDEKREYLRKTGHRERGSYVS